MTDKELKIFNEDVKNGFAVFKKCTIVSYVDNNSVKYDKFGEIRELSVTAHVWFKQPVDCAELYTLLLKPKRNEIKVVPSYGTEKEFPNECLKFIADKFNLKFVS